MEYDENFYFDLSYKVIVSNPKQANYVSDCDKPNLASSYDALNRIQELQRVFNAANPIFVEEENHSKYYFQVFKEFVDRMFDGKFCNNKFFILPTCNHEFEVTTKMQHLLISTEIREALPLSK